MLVFVDESGDTGLKDVDGSSRYFVLTLVLFEMREAAEEMSVRIDRLRQELHLPPHYEFHFFKTKSAIHRAFLTEVSHGRFSYCSLIVDKRKLSGLSYDKHDSFCRSVCEITFTEARPWLNEANVLFDESGSREFRKSLASHLLRVINREGDVIKRIKKIGTQRSQGNNLLQVADMICGAISRSCQEYSGAEKNNAEFRELIKSREQWIRRWPE